MSIITRRGPLRKAKRVLVMIEFEDGDAPVYDLTQLATQMQQHRNEYSGQIEVTVKATRNFGQDAPGPTLEVSFGGYASEFVHNVAYIEDVVNFAVEDGERVVDLRKKAQRLRKRAEKVDEDAHLAKLEQVAGIRAQYPVARVVSAPMQALAE